MTFSLLPWLASALILAGAAFSLLGAVGVLRLPDCYTRMHAASKAGALGAVLILAGVAAGSKGAVALEAVFALLVLLGTAPLAAHAVSRAAHRAGIKPVVGRLGDALEDVTKLEGGGEGGGLSEEGGTGGEGEGPGEEGGTGKERGGQGEEGGTGKEKGGQGEGNRGEEETA
jgi:multicomponent Na+:H+ antiporter subunit G